eukprot:622377-Prymnesium_polylepis.1
MATGVPPPMATGVHQCGAVAVLASYAVCAPQCTCVASLRSWGAARCHVTASRCVSRLLRPARSRTPQSSVRGHLCALEHCCAGGYPPRLESTRGMKNRTKNIRTPPRAHLALNTCAPRARRGSTLFSGLRAPKKNRERSTRALSVKRRG